MDMQMGGQGEKKVCNCPHHSVMPWAIILIGVVIILAALNIFSMTTSWIIVGVLVVIAGFVKLMGRKCKCC
jgi:hypothetical protein